MQNKNGHMVQSKTKHYLQNWMMCLQIMKWEATRKVPPKFLWAALLQTLRHSRWHPSLPQTELVLQWLHPKAKQDQEVAMISTQRHISGMWVPFSAFLLCFTMLRLEEGVHGSVSTLFLPQCPHSIFHALIPKTLISHMNFVKKEKKNVVEL